MVAHQKAVPFMFFIVDCVSYFLMPMIVKPMLTHVVCNASYVKCMACHQLVKVIGFIPLTQSHYGQSQTIVVKVKHCPQVHAMPGLQNSSAQNHNICSPISAAFALFRRPPAYVLAHLSASCSAVELQGETVACRTLESCTFEPLTAILNGVS